MTVTGPTIAAWTGTPDPGWRTIGATVTYRHERMLQAVNDLTAHAFGVVLAGPLAGGRPVGSLTARDRAIYAGADLLAHATSEPDAVEAVARLNAHPAAAVLGAGLAVAADPACGAYRIDPGWLLAHDDRPWTQRAEEALSHVGCEAEADGTQDDATIDCRYRGVQFSPTGTPARRHSSFPALTFPSPQRQPTDRSRE